MSTPQPPTVADVERIATASDPILRNLQITQCYAELSAFMATRTGPSPNWCTFATWASKQAGQTIRQEDLVRRFRQMWADTAAVNAAPPAAGLPPEQAAAAEAAQQAEATMWQLLDPHAPFQRASAAVATGNKKVFEEIAREFARFYATCFGDVAYDAVHIASFCAALRAGDPPEGQQYLRRAFTRYYAALFEADAKRRAELLLLANIEIGYHEQTRLQPEIAAALDAPFPDPRQLGAGLDAASLLPGGWTAQVDTVADRFAARVRYLAHLVITEWLMTITLPGGKYLRLGRDLRADYPPSLIDITHAELRDLLARVDPTPDSIDATGAADWGRLTDRLHFIVDMFRCYGESSWLFAPPFTDEQMNTIKRGRRPRGEL
jgi:hypothetical protein